MLKWYRSLATGLLLIPALLGCEQTFQPLQPNDDLFFSIYGYLDASADTQWIRVMPIRSVAATSPEPIDVTVQLEHLGTGRAISVSDSLFTFPAHHVDSGIDRYAWNFWTAEKMEPGETYRVTVTRADGASSSATARVPEDVPEVIVEIPQAPFRRWFNGLLRLPGAEYLALVGIVHRLPCPAAADTIPRSRAQALPDMSATDRTELRVNLRRELFASPNVFIGYPSGCQSHRFHWWDINFVLTGSPWPYDPDWSDAVAFLPDAAANVTNGAGFLGGVITRTIPFENCYLIGLSGTDDYCALTYSARSATVEGVVTDATCPNQDSAVSGVTVFLWEDLRPDVDRAIVVQDYKGASISLRKPDGVKVRTAYTDKDGAYRFDALESGFPYRLITKLSGYAGDEDRIVLEAGQQLRLDLDMARSAANCGV